MLWLSNNESTEGFVQDGYERAIKCLEAEIRAEVEAKYALQLEQFGFFQRQRLRGDLQKEIAGLVAERSKLISQKALF
jgi:hypothetical protein